MSVLHVRYNGESFDLLFEDIDVGDLSTDQDVKQAVANHFSAPVTKMNGFVVDRNAETGDMTLRPQAVFG